MANKYLNDTGLLYFYNKLKTVFQMQESGKGLSTNDYTTTEKNKLSGIASGAEVNQNAFSNVKVGTTTVAADGKTDTLELVAGSNITLTPDATNDKVTIAATDTKYTAASANPLMDGTAAVGTSAKYAREDHVHPSDTSRVPTTRKVNGHALSADVTVTKSDIGLGNVDNTADANKPISTATQTALDSKLETVKVNGTALTVTDKSVDVTVPIASAEEVNGSTEYLKLGVFGIIEGEVSPYRVPMLDASGLMNQVNLPAATSSAKGAVTVDTALSSTSKNPLQNKAINTALGNKANLASPTFTGTPKAPTASAGTNTTQIATTAFVKTAVDNAVSGITQFDFEIVTSLPTTGVKGKIYLVAHSHGTGDAYDEYIWTGSAFEKIGNTDIDLSGYMKTTDMVAITTSEIDTLFA